VVILSTEPVRGGRAKADGKRCFLPCRFADDDTQGTVGSRGLLPLPEGYVWPEGGRPKAVPASRAPIGAQRSDAKGPAKEPERHGLTPSHQRLVNERYASEPEISAEPAKPRRVTLCFTVEFKVPAEKAGVIESVLELLRGEGTADVVGVKSVVD
jgi:hypothetical protein